MDPIVVNNSAEKEKSMIEDNVDEDGTFDELEMDLISEEEWAKILSSDFDAEAFDAFDAAGENSTLYEDVDDVDDVDDDEEKD